MLEFAPQKLIDELHKLASDAAKIESAEGRTRHHLLRATLMCLLAHNILHREGFNSYFNEKVGITITELEYVTQEILNQS